MNDEIHGHLSALRLRRHALGIRKRTETITEPERREWEALAWAIEKLKALDLPVKRSE